MIYKRNMKRTTQSRCFLLCFKLMLVSNHEYMNMQQTNPTLTSNYQLTVHGVNTCVCVPVSKLFLIVPENQLGAYCGVHFLLSGYKLLIYLQIHLPCRTIKWVKAKGFYLLIDLVALRTLLLSPVKVYVPFCNENASDF